MMFLLMIVAYSREMNHEERRRTEKQTKDNKE